MSEKGQVIEVADDYAKIRLGRTDACSKCNKCSAGSTNEFMIATVKNKCGAKKGDWVFIEVEQKAFATATLIMYGIPLIAFFVGVLAGWLAVDFVEGQSIKEIVSFSTGVLFVLIAYFIISLNEKRFRSKELIPVAVGIADDSVQKEEK